MAIWILICTAALLSVLVVFRDIALMRGRQAPRLTRTPVLIVLLLVAATSFLSASN